MRPSSLALLFSALLASSATAAPAGNDAALAGELNQRLLSHDSATAVLEGWCGEHGLAQPAKIVARLSLRADEATARVRRDLHVSPHERVRHRRVELVCGTHVLSHADNWYLPGRLTPEMNRLLDETDTPFGKAVKALDFKRRTLSVEMLAQPGRRLPEDVLRHRAVLSTPDGRPFSEVVETYTREIAAKP